mmetsp:Transcript_11313/g.32499  ORF Transcript_11313/g.32499 Transcript_11313/m.32499 type:complete len:99 (-) Transcript_11313:695-991(-)
MEGRDGHKYAQAHNIDGWVDGAGAIHRKIFVATHQQRSQKRSRKRCETTTFRATIDRSSRWQYSNRQTPIVPVAAIKDGLRENSGHNSVGTSINHHDM